MSVPPTDLSVLASYQLRLPSFEGPLDVLLRLIERSQLAITDVSLVSVTDQFLRHVADLGGAPPETMAEFAAVGARLVLLKSRTLLPRPPLNEENEETGDLVRQLAEYQKVKATAAQLEVWDASGNGAFPRGDAVLVPGATQSPRLATLQANALARALRHRLTALPAPPEMMVVRRVVSLREMVERVLAALGGGRDLQFSDLAAGCNGRHEILTAFLAVLVLVRRRVVDAEQESLFGEISLRSTRGVAPVELHAVSLAASD